MHVPNAAEVDAHACDLSATCDAQYSASGVCRAWGHTRDAPQGVRSPPQPVRSFCETGVDDETTLCCATYDTFHSCMLDEPAYGACSEGAWLSAAEQVQHHCRDHKGWHCRAFRRSFICLNLWQGSATLEETKRRVHDDQVSTQGTPRAMACIAFTVFWHAKRIAHCVIPRSCMTSCVHGSQSVHMN